MDPVTAIGLASSLITFVDFSWSLVAGAHEIYTSVNGTTSEHDHINNVIEDLQELSDDLGTGALGDSKHEKALKRLAFQCSELSDELLGILRKLRVTEKNSKWKAIKAKWGSMRKRDEISSIRERLGEYRSQILLHLNMMLIGERSVIKSQMDRLEAEGERISTSRFLELDSLQRTLASILKQPTSSLPQNTSQFFWNQHTSSFSVDQAGLLQRIKQPLDLGDLVWRIPREYRILRSIYYDAMNYSEEAIHDAEQGTVSWLLDASDNMALTSSFLPSNSLLEEQRYSRHLASQKLVNWLRSGSGVFHLSGKAGSGKSTAMKLIRHHSRTSEELASWARGRTLVLALFFFWNSEEALQMSLEGLYRSILFEVLKACPELISEVFPEQ
ncbi:hypothetical protein EG329_008775 [Mollisiaceae sp. DMI_Dod_QoI]|nr:hypothetical protein EG329_008775 [Helotiales sp. DMI_Dod_QoI]